MELRKLTPESATIAEDSNLIKYLSERRVDEEFYELFLAELKRSLYIIRNVIQIHECGSNVLSNKGIRSLENYASLAEKVIDLIEESFSNMKCDNAALGKLKLNLLEERRIILNFANRLPKERLEGILYDNNLDDIVKRYVNASKHPVNNNIEYFNNDYILWGVLKLMNLF